MPYLLAGDPYPARDGRVHTNGIESFWSMLKRARKGTSHELSPEHLGRYAGEFAERHSVRDMDAPEQRKVLARKETSPTAVTVG